ncbi:BTB/POZ domain-containing protein 6-B-like [Mytilus californianus]|uniref:BTB/POZ domain-containing protein 6-B-like n=1 Tax=Mytilus californianus TaxID=6549 RepID=UPI002245CA9B|nr:BTB/POZ domain-containing protein 6-B-like [Mytilus californianus]XP_052096984.1 BTB/POZ domain-containing protein 6-B-like [Mytilus californianus]
MATAEATTTEECLCPQDCKSMNESLFVLCCSADMSDVVFTFPGESNQRLHAHKFALAVRSSVFKAMFFGNLPEKSPEIAVTDVSLEIFTALMRYIYTDVVNLDGNNVTPMLHAATKYALTDLAKQCERYLECAIDVDNACVIYNQATFFGMHELANMALLCIEINAKEVFGTEGFDTLVRENIWTVFKSERLKAKEIDMFNAVVKWAKNQCELQNLEGSGENQRKILGDLLNLIRIPLLTLEEYSKVVVKSGLLTAEEQLMFYKYFTLKDEEHIEIPLFSCEPRNGLLPFSLDVNDLLASHVGQKTIESFCFETLNITTKVPLRIRQITLLPIPEFMSGQSNIDYDASNDSLHNSVSVVVKNTIIEPPKIIHQGDRYPLKGSNVRLDYLLSVYPENRLKISVARICHNCGILHSPPYKKINMISSRYGNRMTQRAPLKSLSICDTQVDISFMGQHLVHTISFEKVPQSSPDSSSSVESLTQQCQTVNVEEN